jgi:hypothetical protein
VPEYFDWPGRSYNARTMTGAWNHPSVGHFATYALGLLAGKRGLLGHDLPVFLALPGLAVLARRRVPELPEVLAGAGWCAGTWLLYALTSNNASGLCCSVRWFVPFLAPGYYALALVLRERPDWRRAFVVLSSWGALLGGIMWWQGPWMKHLVPFFWPIQAACLLTLVAWGYRVRRRGRAAAALVPAGHETAARAA